MLVRWIEVGRSPDVIGGWKYREVSWVRGWTLKVSCLAVGGIYRELGTWRFPAGWMINAVGGVLDTVWCLLACLYVCR